jgi:hypothetical protein
MLRGGDAGIRIALSGQISRPHIGLGWRMCPAPAAGECQKQNDNKAFHL